MNFFQQVIIFDSPDGTGKTEMATRLSEATGVPYFRMATQHENWRNGRFKECLEIDQPYLASFLKQTGHSAIIDRAYPSEFAYSKVFGRETNEKALWQVDRMFAEIGTKIIVPLRRDYFAGGAKEDEVVAARFLPDLHRAYEEFMARSKCRCIPIYVDDFENKLELEMVYLLCALDPSAGREHG